MNPQKALFINKDSNFFLFKIFFLFKLRKQLQLNDIPLCKQTPLFKHGFEAHGFCPDLNFIQNTLLKINLEKNYQKRLLGL